MEISCEMKKYPGQSSFKGRGALTNPDNRFYSTKLEAFNDGWWQEENPDSIATVYLEEKSKKIISTNKSPDVPFDQSINPYMGCEHGCIYCFARPTHAYWDLSPGIDFETRILIKKNASQLLRTTLEKKGYQCKVINIGANTDPYQPLEKKLKITRQILEVLAEFKHPFSLITKSSLILRDLDILRQMAGENLCSVAVSVTTLENELKRKLEPRTASPKARLKVISQLSSAGIPVTLLVAPIIPIINDHELENILKVGREAGAQSARYIFIRLPLETGPLMHQWLNEHYPDKAGHVISLIRQSRNGKDYEAGFGQRMTGQGVFAEMINQRFHASCKKIGFNEDERFELDTSRFVRREQSPQDQGYQADLFS